MKEPSIEEQLVREWVGSVTVTEEMHNAGVIWLEAVVGEVTKGLQSERRKAAIEAKITELENIHGWWTHGDNDLEPKNLLHRIKDIKATLQDKKESD